MKRYLSSCLITLLLLSVGVAFAGGDHEGKSKTCSADAQTCVNKMAAHMSSEAWDGIQVEALFTGEKVIVNHVEHGSPGEKAGIRNGDELLKMNGQAMASMNKEAFYHAMAKIDNGDVVTYAVVRNGHTEKVKVTMAAMPRELAAKAIGYHMLTGHAKIEGAETMAKN